MVMRMCEAALAHLVSVRDVVPMARRGRNWFLSLDGNRHHDLDILLRDYLFDDLVIFFYGHIDSEVLLDDDGNTTLDHYFDGCGHGDSSLEDLLDGSLFESVDEGNLGHVIGFAYSDDEGFFIGDGNVQFLGFCDGHVGPDEDGHFAGDRLNVVLGDLAFFAGDDDLDLSG